MGYEQAAYVMALARVPTFSHCSEHQLVRLAELSHVRSVAPGEVVIEEGADAKAFFLIMQGDAVVSRGGLEVATLHDGDYFGELALFDTGPRNATVTATSDGVLAVLLRERFQVALDDVPMLRDALLHGMAHRLHELDSKLCV